MTYNTVVDFCKVTDEPDKRGVREIRPDFEVVKSKDLMIRGGDFYAIWVPELGRWSTEEQDAINLIDRELDRIAEEHKDEYTYGYKIMHIRKARTRMITDWHKFCKQDMRDNYKQLDEKLIFSNSKINKKDYASKRLNYPLEACEIPCYEKIISTLYSPEERHKIEWAIGSIVSGDSKKIQKFMVLYGSHGTGKSTIINIIQQLFDGYCETFDAKALGSSNAQFALEPFKTNPLVAIQHDGNLSRIEDNTRLNSLVSHEKMTVNEKNKSQYTNSFKAFLIIGTNEPVKITNAKSGLMRRLIDVTPSGNKLPTKEYHRCVEGIEFELGGIASHCLEVYKADPHKYDDYVPVNMLDATNDFYNFVTEKSIELGMNGGITAKAAWEMYKTYCDFANINGLTYRPFKEELKNYFSDYKDRYYLEDGTRVRNYYIGFRTDKIEFTPDPKPIETPTTDAIIFKEQKSLLDEYCKDCLAQYASDKETPIKKWENVTTKLADISTSKLHYLKVPENHIVIDFDKKGDDGGKSFEKNLEAASKWPATYAELSKSGSGIHLHYLYSGDVSTLARLYEDDVEIKVFTGKSSLRRKLTKCNDIPIATISSGLPLKGEKVVNKNLVISEKGLRSSIKKALDLEVWPNTKPSVDFIHKVLEDAYISDLKYDVSDMRNAVLAFAANSTHNSEYCMSLVQKMHFKSKEAIEGVESEAPIAFYDIEVFPNLLLVNWKLQGEGNAVVRMINPTPAELEPLLQFRLVGFNCRRYDNHIIYARWALGYTNEQLYNLSQQIINGKGGFFGNAYNLSYTDVYDFSSKKQSLKKFEIELGIHHQELGLPWDEPVPEERWTEVAEYCDNDVIATEAVFNARKADFTARLILADAAGMTANDTTNSLTTRLIFGKNRNPQGTFNYRDLSKPVRWDESIPLKYGDKKFRVFDEKGQPLYFDFDPNIPLPEGYSILPFFPDYKYENGKSVYLGKEIGEGGNVYACTGLHGNVPVLDIASMHPTSVEEEMLFGPEFTPRFSEIKLMRILIKHKEFDKAKTLLGGVLAKYLEDESTAKALSQALKIAINSVYGLTSASFENPFRDPRNVDNIVAKRGALFMENLKHEVWKRGFRVAHIKTDSIKIPDATPEIIQFVMDYGKEYGYIFEHEHTYDRMCLVNDAVYIAKYSNDEKVNGSDAGKWEATGKQFQIPYIYKSLFTKEQIVFDDLCVTQSATTSLYLDFNEDLLDVSVYEKELKNRIEEDIRAKDPYNHGLTPIKLNPALSGYSTLELEREIAKGHKLIFVGKVGRFVPVKEGTGGGLLLREQKGKYNAAAGSKGYRWKEAEVVADRKLFDTIDKTYWEQLASEARASIEMNGDCDFEWFVSDEPYIGPEFKDGKPLYLDKVELPWNESLERDYKSA